MPFFVTRRIIEGLGWGLARRAGRKLVPVVLTLGSDLSGFPRKLSWRRLKLPRQPGRGASLALASAILALGAGPLGFPKQLSGRRPKLPRQTRAALRYSGAGGWPVGLPETIFRVTSKASATASLALASVVLALGGGRTGFPTSFRAMQSGGILDGQWPQGPFYQSEVDKWPDLEIRAADGRFHIVPYKEFISGQAEPFLSRACRIATLLRPASRSCRFVKPRRGASLALASVILALGAGPLLLETGKPAPSLACVLLF